MPSQAAAKKKEKKKWDEVVDQELGEEKQEVRLHLRDRRLCLFFKSSIDFADLNALIVFRSGAHTVRRRLYEGSLFECITGSSTRDAQIVSGVWR